MKNLFLTFFTLVIAMNTYAATWYVNINASGTNNGTSWSDAFIDLQDAIAASSYGDEIWVALGIYKPTSGTSKTISFTIKNGTKVYGGFIGTETLLTQRDYQSNVTTLSGEIGTGASNDNSYTVVYFNNVNDQTMIDGFVITGGNNGGTGAGINSKNSSATIKNCKIQGNKADVGAGINHDGTGYIKVEKCEFSGNVSTTQGGAINIWGGTNNSVNNCYFHANQAPTGSVISLLGTSSMQIIISNCIVAGNTGTGSTIYANSSGTLKVYNSLLIGNYNNSGEVIGTQSYSSTKINEIINCTIAHNNRGDAASNSVSNAVALNKESKIYNSISYGNIAKYQILNSGSVVNSCIVEPTATFGSSWVNINSSNPLFVNPGSASNAPFDTTGLNYHVTNFSPAIDFGLNANVFGSSDLDGNARIHNSKVDAGAYENIFCNSSLTLSPSGPYAICSGTPITLSVNNATNSLWSTGSTSNPLTISTAGTYSVIFEDANGCRGTATAVVSSSATPTPVITFANGQLQTTNFSSYQWGFNGTSISGETTNTHTPLEGYGQYDVTVINSSGCSANATYCLSPASLTASGATEFCQGGTVTLTVNDGTSQVWSTGAMSSSINVSTSGLYFVTVSNSVAGCTVKLEQNVTVNPVPNPTVSITSDGKLTTQVYASYQWFYNGNLISGATTQTIEPTNGNGQYSVKVTSPKNCEGTSAIFNLTNVGIDDLSKNDLLVYPNPIDGNAILHLVWSQPKAEIENLQILDVTGALVYTVQSELLPNEIQLPNLQSGLYFLSVSTNKKSNLLKIKLIVQ